MLDRTSDVLFGERSILLDARKRSPSGRELIVLDRLFTYEPLALALSRDDEDFRLEVDQSLSNLSRSGAIQLIYRKYFGEPDDNHVDVLPAQCSSRMTLGIHCVLEQR